jgi:hypothetical protein
MVLGNSLFQVDQQQHRPLPPFFPAHPPLPPASLHPPPQTTYVQIKFTSFSTTC